ncbi:unnamed protein product [Acanthoscelides obtectus]|nr:unnamed protein product [Acanthoscelides obtectus]CAH2010396.1 unnamed protein product [Acanthoscelides obtectus]CAK1658797.1 Exportin-2 [Acanthoscelides obtectus]CAK1658810.1 Exportin-2 [Acanthoscelides obtectus]
MPVDESTLPDDHFIEVDDTPTFQTASAKLNFANSTKNDPLEAVSEPRQFLVQNLSTLGRSQPGRLPTLISNTSADCQRILQQYCAKFSVQLV